MKRRRIAVVTGSRADYGHLYPVLRAMDAHDALELQVIVTGMHLAAAYGLSVREIEGDGFVPAARVNALLASDSEQALSQSVGLGVLGFAEAYERLRPEIVVLFGDRFEMFAAAAAAAPFRVPLAHIGGGENTVAVTIDVVYRAAMTKMSHLHFVAVEPYRRKLLAMGEEDWRIHVVGSPTLDYIRQAPLLSREELARRLDLDPQRPVAVVTYHPVTMEDPEDLGRQVDRLLEALDRFPHLQPVMTYPNADTRNADVVQRLEAYARRNPRARLFRNLGSTVYLSLLSHAAVMVGNSSSGIIEAPSFRLPVVNIGTRQADRLRAANVIDVGHSTDEIVTGIRRGLDPVFRAALAGLDNPYGDGHAGERVAEILARVPLDRRLLIKETAAPYRRDETG
ncbi:MAG TPA: UDP-N-acetylglucosamine 2-epimerase [Bacillota bacterium]